jgi:hypothetical protein
MTNKYYGYIYLILLPYNSIDKYPECYPFYFGQRKGEFNPYYYGSGRIINDWFKSKLGQTARSTRPTLADRVGVKRYVLVYGKSKSELDRLEKYFVNPVIGTYGCLNINEGGNTPSEEFITSIIIRNKDIDFRKRISEGQKKAWESEDRRRKLADWHDEYWNDPSNHEKHSKAIKENHNVTQETKEKISTGNKLWWENHPNAKFWHHPGTGKTYLQEKCPPECIHGMAKRNVIYDGMFSPDLPNLF